MNDLLKFMGDHPFFTIILLIVVGEIIHGSISRMRGCKKQHIESCPMCGLAFVKKKKEE